MFCSVIAYADQHVAIASALDVRIAQAMILPGTSLNSRSGAAARRWPSPGPLARRLSTCVQTPNLADGQPRSGLGRRNRGQMTGQLSAAARRGHGELAGRRGEFARLRGAKALFERATLPDAWPSPMRRWHMCCNRCCARSCWSSATIASLWSDSGDWHRCSCAGSGLRTADAGGTRPLLKARIDVLRAQILSFSDGPKGRARPDRGRPSPSGWPAVAAVRRSASCSSRRAMYSTSTPITRPSKRIARRGLCPRAASRA